MINKIIIADNLELTPENGYYIQEANNIGYSTKYSVSDILMKHGVKLSNVLYKNKLWSITLIVMGDTFSELASRRNTLFSVLTVDPYNKDDKINFEFVTNTGLNLILSGVVKDVNSDLKSNSLLATPINFVIETEYPFLVTSQQYQKTLNIAIGGGCAVPMEIPLDISSGAVLSTTISNGGNIFAFPIIRFYGPLDTPVINDLTNNVSLSINTTIASGDWIEIDTYNRTAIDNDGSNVLDLILGDYLILKKGDNQLQLLTNETSDDGYVIITWQYHYVSL